MTEKDEGISLKHLFEIVYHYLWVIVLGISMGLGFFYLTIVWEKNKYEASGSLLVAVDVKTDSSYAQARGESMVKTVNSIVTKDSIIVRAIESLQMDISINKFLEKYTITHEIDNYFIEVKCVTTDGENINRVVNAILDSTVSYMTENESLYALDSLDLSLVVTEYSTYETKIEDSRVGTFLTCLFAGGISAVLFIVLFLYISNGYIGISEFTRDMKTYNEKIEVFKRKEIERILQYNILPNQKIIIDSKDIAWCNKITEIIKENNISNYIVNVDGNMQDKVFDEKGNVVIIDEKVIHNTKGSINYRLRKYMYKDNDILYFVKK